MISQSRPTPITHYFRDFGRIVKRHHLSVTQFLVCTHVIRRPCWFTKQKQNAARVLYNNRDKFPRDVFAIVQYINMAAMTCKVFAALNLVRGGYISIFSHRVFGFRIRQCRYFVYWISFPCCIVIEMCLVNLCPPNR